MAKRRGTGEGSVYRREDGVWVASVTIGCDESGRRRRRVAYAKTQAGAIEKLTRLQSMRLDGTLAEPTKLRVGEYLSRWLEDSARPNVRPATYSIYEGLIRVHVKDRIGGVALSKLTPAHIQGVLSALEREGVSPRLRQMVHAVLRRALRQAVKWNMIPRNPAAVVDRPRAPRPEIKPLDAEQCRRLLEGARGERLEALYVLAVTTGLRQGELLGLRWSDVEFAASALHVRRTLSEDQHSGRLNLTEPKTSRSRRRVDLPARALEALRTHRERLGAVPHPELLVFTDSEGGPIRKSNLLRRSFKPLLERAGLPLATRFHDLRHSAATLLLAQGVHPKIVQERPGHSTITLTLDTYSHVLEGMQREAATKLDAILGA